MTSGEGRAGSTGGLGWLAAGVAYTVAYLAAGTLLRESPGALLWFRTLALFVPPLLGVMVIVRRRRDWTGCHSLFWATIALGLVISAVGFLGWTLDEVLLARQTSWLGWHAVFALFGAAAPLFALLAQPHRGPREGVAATTAVDIAGIAVLTGFLYSYFVVGSEAGALARPSGALVFLSLLQQFLVFAGLATVSTLALGQPWGRTYMRIGLGALVGLVMLALTNAGIWQGHYQSVFVYDFTWILPFFFFPWAAAEAPASAAADAEVDESELSTPSRPWLIFIALGLIPLIDAGLRSVFPVPPSVEGFRNLSMAITVVSVLPLLMARLVVERAALTQADARLRLLATAVEQTADLVLIFTREGQIQHANRAFSEAVGYTPAELTTLTSQDLTMESMRQQFEDLEGRVRAQGVWRGIQVRRRRDGSSFTVASTIAPLVARDGTITHFIGVERDITEEMRLRDQVVQSERRYRALFDHAPLGIFRASPDGRFLTVSLRLAEMLGWDPPEALMTTRLAELWADPAAGARVWKGWRARGTIDGEEVSWLRRDGADLRVRLSGRIGLDEGTGEEVFEVFAEDVTAHRELEEGFRQAQKMEAIGRLAGGVAHDFNNQLTVIRGYSDLLIGQLPEDEPIRQDLAEILRAAESSTALTRQLLAFSRRQLMKLDVLDLNQIVGKVESMLRRVIGEDITVETRLQRALPSVKADGLQLEQVLLNLAVNARDAMPDGGALVLETAVVEVEDVPRPAGSDIRAGRYVRLAVSDNGCGMDEHTRTRVFEPFFTTKEQGRGTGLGLATVYGIVKQLGGYIWVYSEPEHGTTFKLYFPAVTAAVALAPEDAPAIEVGTGSEAILVVEDEPAVRRFTAAVLRQRGYRVIEASCGEEALEVAARMDHIDLVLTDVIMPGMNGPEVLARIRETRAVKGLFMSGYTEKVLRDGVLGQQIDLIEKPFGPQDLLRKVRDVLDEVPAAVPSS